MLSRRQFLSVAGTGAGVLIAGGWALHRAWPDSTPRGGRRFLGDADAVLIAALAPVVIGFAGVDRAAVLRGFDLAAAGLPPGPQRQLRRLLDVLGSRWGRHGLAGVTLPWGEAAASEIEAFLQRWRLGRLQLLRGAYQALHALICAAWYGNPASWEALDYRQPPVMEWLP
ncbi:hypothetical protein [Paludibacterium yongneupense]|uniref:hypothetical protein n=1 Tax=Paludibacterium yongneupense TaxID=400061 RepID=UPI000425FD36|nr:hypothetical protein [Paludibacterium yongneupense]